MQLSPLHNQVLFTLNKIYRNRPVRVDEFRKHISLTRHDSRIRIALDDLSSKRIIESAIDGYLPSRTIVDELKKSKKESVQNG